MSCNGCRILRKGCNENCILRQSLHGIESPQAQANATVFVAKFFGRAGLMSFLSAVPESQRPALFQSLLFEACGRTVNPVNGAVGLLWTGNWHVCQAAVETVLRGGVLRPLPELSGMPLSLEGDRDDDVYQAGSSINLFRSQDANVMASKRKVYDDDNNMVGNDLDLGLGSGFPARMTAGGRANKRRPATPSGNSEESDTTTLESGTFVNDNNNQISQGGQQGQERKLLRLFF